METRRTEVGKHIKGGGIGAFYLVCGAGSLIASLAFFALLPVVAIIIVIIGIWGICSGIALISHGGARKAVCPYCQHEITIFENAKTNKCVHCKKVSTRIDNYLETIE